MQQIDVRNKNNNILLTIQIIILAYVVYYTCKLQLVN